MKSETTLSIPRWRAYRELFKVLCDKHGWSLMTLADNLAIYATTLKPPRSSYARSARSLDGYQTSPEKKGHARTPANEVVDLLHRFLSNQLDDLAKNDPELKERFGSCLAAIAPPQPRLLDASEPGCKENTEVQCSNDAGADFKRTGIEPLQSEIQQFLDRNRIMREFDGYLIDVLNSPELKGWKRNEVSHIIAGPYEPPPELQALMKRFQPTPPIHDYFSLSRCSPLPIADRGCAVQFELKEGTFHHVFTQQKIFTSRKTDEECRLFREKFEDSWIQYDHVSLLEGTPVYHQVHAQVLLVSSDDQLVLGRRNDTTDFHGGWSASLEEQMLRRDVRIPSRRDGHIFDAAERGVREEMGVTVIPEATTLLKLGIEWGNFSAAFVFLVRCEQKYDKVCECWAGVKHDPNEAVGLDCLEATPERIQEELRKETHAPSNRFRQRVKVRSPESGWHPTSKARLRAFCAHLEFLKELE